MKSAEKKMLLKGAREYNGLSRKKYAIMMVMLDLFKRWGLMSKEYYRECVFVFFDKELKDG